MKEEIKLEINDKKGQFSLFINGKEQGLITFLFDGKDKIIIDHTEVYPGNEGKGLGKKLVSKTVQTAREKHWKIVPVCSFAKKVIDRTPEFQDVLYSQN